MICKYKMVLVLSLLLAIFLGACSNSNGGDKKLHSESDNDSENATQEPSPMSQYVAMQDGTRIAVDVWLPQDVEMGSTVPTVIRATRYWRDYDPLNRAYVGVTSSEEEAAIWTAAGMALALVDVRGTGASFGQWTGPWSPQEVSDLGEVVDWITAQSWSDGQVGSQGISYDGNTADFIGLLQSDAVKVVAPLFSDVNVYTDGAYPGGIYNAGFVEAWNRENEMLDLNDICAIEQVDGEECQWLKTIVSGVRPVDGDEAYSLLNAAVAEHVNNLDVFKSCGEAPFWDSLIGTQSHGYMEISPSSYYDRLDGNGPAYIVQASWSDAGTANGALSRFKQTQNNTVVFIGPWSHGGDYNTDPFMDPNEPLAPSYNENLERMIGLFRHYFSTEQPGVTREIQYYTLGEGVWRSTAVWPPSDVVETPYYLGPGGALSVQPSGQSESSTNYTVDFTATTGTQNRWWTQNGGDDVVYPDRSTEDEKLLTFTSAPLEKNTRLTGHPEVWVHLSSTHQDGALYVYLEDVAPDGKVTYLTEGQLRLIHRKISTDIPPWHLFGPYHSFRENDAQPMVPGEPAELAILLQPVAAQIKKGHSIRVAFSGHDCANFVRLPPTGNPTLSFYHDDLHPSRMILPLN